MRVLQICNGFAGSKVHSNLIKENDILGIHQTIYCPVRDSKLLNGNKFESKNTEFIYSYIIKSWYKFFYHYKRRVIFNDLKNKINLPKNDLIHAATLFSDGAIAYMIYKKYHIPYVVAVRNTDVNLFGKKLPHTWSFAKNILLNAKKIYFISNALKQSFETLSFVKPILKQIENKFIFRPNGVEKVWLDNIQTSKCSEANKILYVGDFSANKNVKRLILSISQLRKENEYRNLELTIIGGGNDCNNETLKFININSDFITYLGKIYDPLKIQDIMREHFLFAMPSIHETFGLVYIEALSQNLPIIFTKGQGVDNIFLNTNNPIGIGVNPLSTIEIKDAIKAVIKNRELYSNRQVDFSLFDWTNIAQMYKNDYEFIIDLNNKKHNALECK